MDSEIGVPQVGNPGIRHDVRGPAELEGGEHLCRDVLPPHREEEDAGVGRTVRIEPRPIRPGAGRDVRDTIRDVDHRVPEPSQWLRHASLHDADSLDDTLASELERLGERLRFAGVDSVLTRRGV